MFGRRGAGLPLIKVFGGTPNALLASAKAEQKSAYSCGKIKTKTTSVTFAEGSSQTAHKSPAIEFYVLADYLY
ncbi:hypothetical protein [Eubacterium coprostanoligenes]|uniref:hypothetical protein n=1 Tax=Eubacterium coprostanoligenes TaxID=290054 RepID=UPI002A800E1A|nr:hypothetical protein [Eubacterium coprostanoligenes]MDY4698800.1 hypothetical protein [Eubacterium coprostanoligenes]